MELVSIGSSLYFWTKKEERTILFLSHRPFVPFLNRWMDIARRLLVGNMTARVRFESAEEARHFNPDSDPVLWLRDGSGRGSGSGRGGRHRCQNERRVASMGGQPRNERVSIVVSFRYRGVKSSAIESAVTRNAVNCRVSASILIRFFSLPHPFFFIRTKAIDDAAYSRPPRSSGRRRVSDAVDPRKRGLVVSSRLVRESTMINRALATFCRPFFQPSHPSLSVPIFFVYSAASGSNFNNHKI